MAPTDGSGTGAAAVVRRVANHTVGRRRTNGRRWWRTHGLKLQRLLQPVLRESPPVRTPCSCPAAASAGAAVYCGAVAGAMVGDGCVVAFAVTFAVPDVVVLQKLLPNLPDSAAVEGVGGVGAEEFLEHS